MVDYSELETAFTFVSMSPPFEHYAYLDKETGKTYYVSELGDSDELPDDLEESEKYIEIPHKNDLGLDRNLVFAFVASNLPDQLEKVRGIFGRRGAYARYKDLLDSKGQLDSWYTFEEKAMEQALRRWCRENGIEVAG